MAYNHYPNKRDKYPCGCLKYVKYKHSLQI